MKLTRQQIEAMENPTVYKIAELRLDHMERDWQYLSNAELAKLLSDAFETRLQIHTFNYAPNIRN